MSKSFKIVIALNALLLILVFYFVFFNSNKIAFFDYNEVYNSSQLKIKLEKDLELVVSKRKSELDSMQMELSFMSQGIESSTPSQEQMQKFEALKNRFLTYKDKYEQENVQLKETYFSQIRKEINDKAILFAQDNDLDYLFAAMGDGALMYGSKANDATQEFKKYLGK